MRAYILRMNDPINLTNRCFNEELLSGADLSSVISTNHNSAGVCIFRISESEGTFGT